MREMPLEEMGYSVLMSLRTGRDVRLRRLCNRRVAGLFHRVGCIGKPKRQLREIDPATGYKFLYSAFRPITDGPARADIELSLPLGTTETVRWHDEFYRHGRPS